MLVEHDLSLLKVNNDLNFWDGLIKLPDKQFTALQQEFMGGIKKVGWGVEHKHLVSGLHSLLAL